MLPKLDYQIKFGGHFIRTLLQYPYSFGKANKIRIQLYGLCILSQKNLHPYSALIIHENWQESVPYIVSLKMFAQLLRCKFEGSLFF